MVSLLDGCSENCGWTAAVIAVLCWGSFGVPLKLNTNVEVNFFVMQSYKTIVCFVFSWMVIFLGEPVRFSPWGIVSGLFWVPGGSCGVYGIRNAGVAISVGTWSAIQVCISFFFGFIVFHEQVKDVKQTILALVILITGLIGMSCYSSTPKVVPPIDADGGGDYELIPGSEPGASKSKSVDSESTTHTPHPKSPWKIIKREKRQTPSTPSISPEKQSRDSRTTKGTGNPTLTESGIRILPPQFDENIESLEQSLEDDGEKPWQKDHVELFGGRLVLPRRQMGILAAVFNGTWGGLNLIPLHYARRDQGLSGAAYLISYGSGSMLVCSLIWLSLFLYHFIRRNYSVREALSQLPAWHVRELGLAGVLCGILNSTGTFCSILAVTYLGQAVGYSFCQGQLLISGLWGVFYFGEIHGRERIAKWFASAAITVLGIICVSYQHEGSHGHRFLSYIDNLWDFEDEEPIELGS